MPVVLGYGLALWDLLAEPAEVDAWTPYPGGAGLNVACHLGRLGIPAALMAGIGQDEWGMQLLQVLQNHQVDTGLIQSFAAPTRRVEVRRRAQGEREFVGFRPANCSTFADELVTFAAPPFIPQYVYIEALVLASPAARAACFQLVQWAVHQGARILVDVNWRPVFWTDAQLARTLILELLQQVQAVKLTGDEAQWLLATDDPGAIQRRYPNLTQVLVTQGMHGCDYCIGPHQGHYPAFPVQAVDTTGAGDAFVAGWLYQWIAQGDDFMNDVVQHHHALRWASAVAAISTTAPGAITQAPTPEKVQQFLTAHC
ncbi:MAG: carbohydrate kinase [Gloeomargarita sp. SKYG116]|nr:carbohydrate kinase [Gloeomargarita sp. SKYG116]MCS7225423.1 carbohydrate kinase [Gloeomargarita sp. SKYB31]MDW8401123.1 carbohydrate kinase [Gloeomargarita sp. SKYGB_i_bin116]